MIHKSQYAKASEEFDTQRDEALWLKALIECESNEEKARLCYIRDRVAEYEELERALRDVVPGEKILASLHNAKVFTENGFFVFLGKKQKDIHEKFCRLTNTEDYTSVGCKAIMNSEYVLITPTVKSSRILQYVGSGGALPGGLIGGALLGVAAAVETAFQEKKIKEQNKSYPSIDNSAVFNLARCVVKGKEVRSGFKLEGLQGPSWNTLILIEGECYFEGQAEKVGVMISFKGRATRSSAFSKRIEDVDKLCRDLNKPIPEIYEDNCILTNDGQF